MAGLAPHRRRGLRHTGVALLDAASVDPSEIARRACHTSVSLAGGAGAEVGATYALNEPALQVVARLEPTPLVGDAERIHPITR